MAKKTFVTNIPDKSGAFMLASKIIYKHQGNIVRVSYNKAVDLHTLFIDVVADEDELNLITSELDNVGYLNEKISETRVIIVSIKIPDISGALLPVLKILDRYDINISYMNSSSTNTDHQDFEMGLLIENPNIVKMVLDDISEIYQINIIDYGDSETTLDNTIFYIRLANDMQKLLNLSTKKTMEFISESNRILQMLQHKGTANPDKVFDYIRRFASFIAKHKNTHFFADIDKININDDLILYCIQPPCGSNIYIVKTENELTLIDTGFAVYYEEMLTIFKQLFPNWETVSKKIYITHADIDHCGLLSKIEDAQIFMNEKSAESIRRQYAGLPDFREANDYCFGYSKLSQIISDYTPVDTDKLNIIGHDTMADHCDLLNIGAFQIGELNFEVMEGSGGHLYGEMIFINKEYGLIFTGDNLVNISGFTPERAEFNSLAPFLMTSVNINSEKAKKMRNEIISLIHDLEQINKHPCIICGGHGPISRLKGDQLLRLDTVETLHL